MENKWTSTPITTSEPTYFIRKLEKYLYISTIIYVWKGGLNMETIFFFSTDSRSSMPKDSSNDNQLYSIYQSKKSMINDYSLKVFNIFFPTLFSYSANFFWLTLCIPKKTWKKVVGFHLFKIDTKGATGIYPFLSPLFPHEKTMTFMQKKGQAKNIFCLQKHQHHKNLFWKAIPDHIKMCF